MTLLVGDEIIEHGMKRSLIGACESTDGYWFCTNCQMQIPEKQKDHVEKAKKRFNADHELVFVCRTHNSPELRVPE